MKLGVAVLGVGRWGVHFVRNFLTHPQTELKAIVDRHPERLAYCREKFALDDNRVTLSTDWSEIRQRQDIQAVIVATPASTHYSLIKDALERGYHVLAEKPLTLIPTECIELTKLAEAKQLELLVDHTYLFNPAVQKGREVIATNKLGQLRYGYATRTHLSPVRQDVDALWDLAIHDLAIFNYWLEETPIKVQARGNVWLQPDKQMSISTQSGLADLVWLTLFYPSGFQATIHLCWLNPDKQRRLCIVGSQGSLIFDEMSADAPLTIQHGHMMRKEENFIPVGQSRQIIPLETAEPLFQVGDRFIQNILTQNKSSISSGWIAAELVKILTGLTQSLAQQGEIISLESEREGVKRQNYLKFLPETKQY